MIREDRSTRRPCITTVTAQEGGVLSAAWPLHHLLPHYYVFVSYGETLLQSSNSQTHPKKKSMQMQAKEGFGKRAHMGSPERLVGAATQSLGRGHWGWTIVNIEYVPSKLDAV